jgi:hypothetical protein
MWCGKWAASAEEALRVTRLAAPFFAASQAALWSALDRAPPTCLGVNRNTLRKKIKDLEIQAVCTSG